MNRKALAGPKQVVNVRFDRSNYTREKNKKVCEHYHIKPHEILVKLKKVANRGNRDRISGVQSWCCSDNQHFDDTYTFAGVAETGQDASHRHSMQQGLAMCVGGIVKAFNETKQMIHAGDELTYGPNHGRTCQEGIPRDKQRVTFIKYDPTNPVHMFRGVVARAESSARSMESYDARLISGAQHVRQFERDSIKTLYNEILDYLATELEHDESSDKLVQRCVQLLDKSEKEIRVALDLQRDEDDEFGIGASKGGEDDESDSGNSDMDMM